jgi:methanethiol oxidase
MTSPQRPQKSIRPTPTTFCIGVALAQGRDQWSVDNVITIPAEPNDADALPPLLKPFGAVPPYVTDIDLSVDDHWLYVSCWGTGELK